MARLDDEEERLRSVASQNAVAILHARERAERELAATRQELRASAERLKLAFAAARLGDWSWDARTDALTFGPRACEIFGLPAGTAITWEALRERIHPEDRERTARAVERAIAEGEDYDVEYRIAGPGGAAHWIAARARPTYGPGGACTGMIGVVQDVTDRKRTEHALRDETRDLELLNETGVGIASQLDLHALARTVTDAGTKLANARYGAFYYAVGRGEEEARFELFAHCGTSREAIESYGVPHRTPWFDRAFRGQGSVRYADVSREAAHLRPPTSPERAGGTLAVRACMAVPIVSRSGRVIGVLAFAHPMPDVFTERAERLVSGIAGQAAVAIDNARLYEAAQQAAEERRVLLESEQSARAEAERLSELKDDFLATLSHELRTPLSAILGWSQVLRRRAPATPEVTHGLEIIERNARLQSQLIEDLLDVSRITSGKVRLDVQPVDPVSFVEAAIETVTLAADAKGVRLEKLLDPGAGPLYGDPNRLQQVVWNLLSNAIKFTPKGGRVQIVLRRVGSHVEIRVADTGIGIAPDVLAHVFERFRQADASSSRRYGGLGIGLSIVKHLVELHGGSVAAQSLGQGHGTTFTVRLPLAVLRRRLDADRAAHAASEKLAAAERYDVADLTGVTVLVVDDESDARALLERVLSDCGARTLTAGSAAEALDVLARSGADVLVTDIGMPDVDGYELLRRVRSTAPPERRRIPAVALTAFARSEDRIRALRAGFQVHVSKPVEPSELVATVASVVGRVPGGA